MNHFNRCQFCLNLDQVQDYGPHCKQCANDRYTHKTDQTMKSRHTLLGQFPQDIWSKCLSSKEWITLRWLSTAQCVCAQFTHCGLLLDWLCLFLFCTDALLFPGQCNILNVFYVSEPCLLGQWASCVLRSWQLDTTFKLLCAVSAWKGSSTFSRGDICPKKYSKLMSVNRVILGSGPAAHSDQNRLTQL